MSMNDTAPVIEIHLLLLISCTPSYGVQAQRTMTRLLVQALLQLQLQVSGVYRQAC